MGVAADNEVVKEPDASSIQPRVYVGEVLKSWNHHLQIDAETGFPVEWDDNKQYITLTCTNGYTYTETSKDITTVLQRLLKHYVTYYERTYQSY